MYLLYILSRSYLSVKRHFKFKKLWIAVDNICFQSVKAMETPLLSLHYKVSYIFVEAPKEYGWISLIMQGRDGWEYRRLLKSTEGSTPDVAGCAAMLQ